MIFTPKLPLELLPDFKYWLEQNGYTYKNGDAYLLDQYGRELLHYPFNRQGEYLYGALKGRLLVGMYNQANGVDQPIKYKLVPSFTIGGLSYVVALTKNPVCTCPDFAFRKVPCRHILHIA